MLSKLTLAVMFLNPGAPLTLPIFDGLLNTVDLTDELSSTNEIGVLNKRLCSLLGTLQGPGC